MFDGVAQDVRYALRLLRRNPLFAVTAAMSVAIGIGANTTIFTIANALLFRSPVGIADPGRIVDIGRSRDGQGFDNNSYPNYLDVRQRSTVFEDVYAYRTEPQAMSLAVPGTTEGAERVYGTMVSGNRPSTIAISHSAISHDRLSGRRGRSCAALYDRHRDLRRILLRVVHDVVRDGRFALVVVVAAGVEVSIEPREVAARHFDAQPVARLEVVARRQRLQHDLVDFSRFHPRERFVVTVAIPHALDGLVEVVRAAVRVYVEYFDREVGVPGVGRHVQRRRDRSAHLSAFLERLRRVDEDVVARFHPPLIERAGLDRVAGAADVAAVREHRIHRIVGERVRLVRVRRRGGERAITRQ